MLVEMVVQSSKSNMKGLITLLLLLGFSNIYAQCDNCVDLTDLGECTQSISEYGCQTFKNTCNGSSGWTASNGTPELISTRGPYCNGGIKTKSINAPFLIGMNSSDGEGIFKPYFFKAGAGYNITITYTISPYVPNGTGLGILNIVAANNLQQGFTGCQSPFPSVNHITIKSYQNYSISDATQTFTFYPTSDYTQFALYATSTMQQFDILVTGIKICAIPVCSTPYVPVVEAGSAAGSAFVQWENGTGVGTSSYNIKFSNSFSTTTFSYVPTTVASSYSATFTGIEGAGNTTVSVQAVNSACTNGLSPWGSYYSTVPIQCICSTASPYVSTVEPGGTGTAYVQWQGPAGVNSYNIRFVNGSYTKTFTYTPTTNTGNYGQSFSGIPAGSYNIAVQANCTCGTGSWGANYFLSPVTIY